MLSRCPVFSVTLDKNFHNIDKDYFELEDIRISLFSFGVGAVKIYFATYKKNEKFRIFRVIHLRDIAKLPLKEEVQDKVESYHQHIEGKQQGDIDIEIDFLKYKIASEESRKNIASNKINNYMAIVLVFISLVFAGGPKFVIDFKNILLTVLAIMASYCLCNVIIYLFSFFKVRSFLRAGFKDLKQSSSHSKKVAESYYEDWYSIKEEATLFVSYALNIERYMKFALVFIVGVILYNTINASFFTSTITPASTNNLINYTVDIGFSENSELQEPELEKLLDIQAKFTKKQVKEVIILREEFNSKLLKRKYDNIISVLRTYNIHKVSIIEICENDNKEKLSKNTSIKILMIGGKQ
jgi:hypothetical protein